MKKALILTVVFALTLISRRTLAAGPEPFFPPDDARLWTGDPIPYFSWSDEFGAFGYYLEFDDDNDWSQSLGGLETEDNYFDLGAFITQSEWDPLVFNLYWRVRAIHFDGGLGNPGPAFHFSKTTADPPEPWTPLHGTILKPWSQPVTFTWSRYPNEHWYELEFAAELEFNQPLGRLPWGQPNLNMINYISPVEWRYLGFSLFWRVSGEDKFGNKSPFGPVAGFSKLGYRRVMCFGDSITGGYGSSTFDSGFGGYPPLLEERLHNVDEKSSITSYWFSGGKAEDGAFNCLDALAFTASGAMVVMFGTVDIIDPGGCEEGQCRTLERLQQIVDYCREYAVATVVCTVIPYNPAGGHPKYPDVTVIQSLLDEINEDIRNWCAEERIAMVDLDQVMRDRAPDGDLTQLYFDWAHPNDYGYQIMADAIFPVLTSNW